MNSECLQVLVVEDNDIAQKIARLILESFGHKVDIAGNGNEALDLFKRKQYQLIFMDLGLPDISGVEVAKEIRNLEKSDGKSPVPIVALTANNKRYEAECLQAGINKFILKPLNKQHVETTIQELVLQPTEHE